MPYTRWLLPLIVAGAGAFNLSPAPLGGVARKSPVSPASSFITPPPLAARSSRRAARMGQGRTGNDFLATTMSSAVTPENPLKVVIAGGGVGGLFLAKALQKKGCKVLILEKTGKFARFGGPIQLASNALATIKGIDETLFTEVMEKFTFTGTRTNGIKDGIRTQWYTKFDAITKMAEYFNLPYTGVVDRPDLQEILLKSVGEDETVRRSSPVSRFEQLGDGKGVKVYLEDGTCEEADVLVGADGIWSTIRAQLWNQDAKGPKSGTTYSGYTCFAGDTIQRPDYYFDVGYQVYIGPGKYFVTSDVGRGRTQWYAFLALPEGTKSRASNLEYLQELFSKGKEGRWSEEVFKVLDATPEENIEQRDLFDRPPSVTKSWSKGHVTMIGDAVHPMMPNLGQGGCQAIEDAYVLSEILGTVEKREDIPGALRSFYFKRLPRTSVIQGLSRIASDLIVSAFDTPFQPAWVDNRYGPLGGPLGINNIFTRIFQPFMGLIFYAQFGYVYTFHPKKCTDEEIKNLVDTVMARHKKEAEATWKRVGMMSQAEIDAMEGREGAGLGFR
ncbi:zeaxanthin epoxidase, plastid-targeted [Guillardia theta CCMP2712]|uniref:Zeaxanthin epoxidase, plastid-targeted n=4 Tax=Guillardia theta TaxID=55529 RepID=L1JNY8_GUITC|nr:zeaxanthin epoxidase, plastid-targeted [Guillardia theta CCMP2712]ACI45952.1 putative plastid zeaxanthin epoxidase precursor [Guillardia theta]EKX50009.1 zeaxanthin epoxidase, plastid-targeted [Guillardia theta CCMP2712]|eukprot:XP_005836989.1 zeaxanthin epoxidase, plastid-targeted [Guillardia theta CCMP2712]